jgi:NDP-sugar pyrophosphorylase family protein
VALAAGVGSRYGGLKQLEPVGPNGETLLEYSIYDALRAGFSRAVLVVRPDTEAVFRQRFDQGMAKHVSLSYVHQTRNDLPSDFTLPPSRLKPWGTGQAVLAAEAEVGGAFAVINADDFYGAASFEALASFLTPPQPRTVPTLAMVGFEVGPTLSDSGPVSRALCQLDDEGRLVRIVEILEMWRRNGGGYFFDTEGQEMDVSGDCLVSMNIWGFIPAMFPELRSRFREFLLHQGQDSDSEFLVPDVIQALMSEGRMQVEVLPHNGQCYGITYPEDRERVTQLIATLTSKGEYPPALWK